MSQAVKLKNAHKMITEVRVDKHRQVLQVKFADGNSGDVPIKAIQGHEGLDLDRVELSDPYVILIGVQGEAEPVGIPWDFARIYCDPAYAEQVKQRNKRDRHALAQNLKQLRSGQGWSQEELAKHSGVSRIMIGRLENEGVSSLSLETLEKLAEALNVDLATLFKPVA